MNPVRFVLLLAAVACDPIVDACDLAAANDACPECSDGEVECTFRDTSVTAVSCGDCQARSGLYQDLCDAGETATAADIEAETVCVNVSKK